MLPSSLVFVALVAVWLVYVVISGLRRREHLTTARSVDRFSTHMRVLQRRAVKNASIAPAASALTMSAPEAGSRATPGAPLTQPVTRQPQAQAEDVVRRAVVRRDDVVRRRDVVRRAVVRRDVVRRDVVRRDVVRRATPPQLLAGALLASLVLVLVTGVAAALGQLRWGWVAGAVSLLVAVLVATRSAAVARRAQRDRQGEARRHQAARAQARAREDALAARPSAPAMPVAQEHVVEPVGVSATVVIPEIVAAGEQSAEPFDLMADPQGWQPQPVPPPTYTLKARADRPVPEPMVAPAALEDVDADEAYDAWVAEMDRQAVGH